MAAFASRDAVPPSLVPPIEREATLGRMCLRLHNPIGSVCQRVESYSMFALALLICFSLFNTFSLFVLLSMFLPDYALCIIRPAISSTVSIE